jgi:serine/threonine-protein kinase RsbW
MTPKEQKISITIPSKIEELNRIEEISEEIAEKMHLTGDEEDNLCIAITEVVGNAIVHGNKKDPKKKVFIEFHFKGDSIAISVRDEGKGFKPDSVSNPLRPENLMKESGRGIFILKALMDDVKFDFTEEGTRVTFVMRLKRHG